MRWPALLLRKTVDEYLDMSEAAFEREVFAGRLPAPLMIGGRDHWRKNAVNALLEAGCTVAEVAAITGQTLQIIEHYAAQVNRKKMGRAAILKWEKKSA